MIAHPRLRGAPEEERVTYTYNIVYREIFDGLRSRAAIPADAVVDMMPI